MISKDDIQKMAAMYSGDAQKAFLDAIDFMMKDAMDGQIVYVSMKPDSLMRAISEPFEGNNCKWGEDIKMIILKSSSLN